MTFVAPLWPQKDWFTDPMSLLALQLPLFRNPLVQPHVRKFHQGLNLNIIKLHAWKLSSNISERQAFEQRLQQEHFPPSENLQQTFIRPAVRISVIGVMAGVSIHARPLFPR